MRHICGHEGNVGSLGVANILASTCTKIYAGTKVHFSDNNYEKTQDLTNTVVIGFAMSIASTVFAIAFLMPEAGQDSAAPALTQDLRSRISPPKMATDSGYSFCNSIQQSKRVNVDTQFTSGRLLADESEIDGVVNTVKTIITARRKPSLRWATPWRFVRGRRPRGL